jgi:hypothetical protein
MPDHHQIVEQIRGFLQSSDQTRNDRLDDLAKAYALACTEANARLARCQRLLQQGLRSEAIQQAEADPRLLDLVMALDFPERADWDEIVDIYAMAAAPKLASDAYAALSDSYAEAEPLQNLLRNHRRLATQRAPLRNRIGVMRKLAAQDTRNPIWTEDLRIFEKARFRQIQTEAAEAIRLHDAAHLSRLLSEVQERTWIEPPPKAIVQGLTKAVSQLRDEQTIAALADLEARLSESLNAQDATRGRAARDEWNTLMATAPVDFTDSIWERVGPALKWLEDEDRAAVTKQAYEADLNALSNALNDGTPISAAELERLEREALRHGRGIPEKIQRRYYARFRTASARRTRRTRIIAIAAAAALVSALILTFYLIQSGIRAGNAKNAAAMVTTFLEKRQFDQAESLLADLEKADASLLADPLLVDARKRCREAREQEVERAEKFQDAMDEIRSAPPEEVEPKAVATARELARGEAETHALEELILEREAGRKNAREKRESGYRPRLESLGGTLKRLAQRLGETNIDYGRFQEELDGSRSELDLMKPQIAKSSNELRELFTDVQERLASVQDHFDQLRGELQRTDEITEAVAYNVAEPAGDLDLFATRLLAFVRSYPQEPSSKAFETTLNERPLWNAVGAWNDLVKNWKKRAEELSAEEVRARAAACAGFLKQNPQAPDPAGVEDYRRYMKSIAQRTSSENNPRIALESLFSQSLIANLYMIVVSDGTNAPKRYYARSLPRESNGKLEVKYIVRRGKDERHVWVLPGDIVSKVPAPQSELAQSAKKLLSDPSKRDRWDDVMINLVRSVLNQPEIDPILRMNLLKAVIELAGAGSEPIRVALEGAKNVLDQAKINLDADWTDPDTDDLEDVRKEAFQVIGALRENVPHEHQLKIARDHLARAVLQIHRTVGWLIRGAEGYVVRHGVALPVDGDLWVLVPSGEKRGEWKKVGTITSGGKQKIDARDPSALAEGRPVFMIVPSA